MAPLQATGGDKDPLGFYTWPTRFLHVTYEVCVVLLRDLYGIATG